MPIFNLTDITFNPSKNATGPNSPLVGSKYEYNMYRYPIDLGASDKAHYMVIHINEQAKTQFGGETTGDKPTVVQDRIGAGSSAGAAAFGGSFSKLVDTTSGVVNQAINTVSSNAGLNSFIQQSSAAGVVAGLGSSVFNFISSSLNQINGTNFVRTVRRTTDTISLYMPDTLNFVYTQNYDTPSIGKNAVAAGISAGASIVDTTKGQKYSNGQQVGQVLGNNLSPFLASLAANSTDIGKVLFAAGTGVVQNPMLEILYSSPAFREFRFDFMFYPRSERESLEVYNLIERLRFHQAPEVVPNSGGFFLVPPSEFDIKFMYNGKENPNIPRISTCVLQSIDVDYAPNGFSAYEVPGEAPSAGRTGMPVAIRLSLNFKETEILTKANYKVQSTASKYGTNVGSQQTAMLAEQDRGFN